MDNKTIDQQRQFQTIFKNIFIIGWRSKEILYEIVFPLITGIVIVIKDIVPGIDFLVPVIQALAINGSTRSLLIRMVEEKSGRYKETQKIMGLKQTPYFLAWYSAGILRTLMSTVCFILLPCIIHSRLKPEEVDSSDIDSYLGFWEIYTNGKATLFVVLYFLYAITSVHQSLFLSTFFSNPKLSGEVGTFFTIISSLGVFLVYQSGFRSHTIWLILLGIFPQPGIGFGYISATGQQAIIYKALNLSSVYSVETAIVQMIIMSLLYMIFYLYLEQVLPNEYGISKHPLFFLQICRQKKNISNMEDRAKLRNSDLLNLSVNQSNSLEQNLLDLGKNEKKQQDVSSALYHEVYQNQNGNKKTIEIGRLSKYFGNTKAVNDISINLYEQNIFCLLGHNGAGKTTLISLLTGLVKKSQGLIRIHDQDLETNLDIVRNNIGICTQRDVVYGELTFEEHLKFMANLKGVPYDKLNEEIENILDKTKCQSQRQKLVKNLSGGNKRKLSLAMALIGGSQIVFLDEPTSGMDAISRRAIWEILEICRKENRTIILTTHHLDEAEVLADRIGIMAKGKLLAVGTKDFIKKNFGVGYHLTVYPDIQKEEIINFDKQMRSQISQIVQQHLPQSTENPQVQKNAIQFLLPFNCQQEFSPLFHDLEKIQGLTINLQMNTLEDAFINIGMDEDKFIKQNSTIQIDNIRNSFQEKQQANFTKFDDIKKPQCISRPPLYSFRSQFTACFLRKFYCTIRVFSTYVGFIIPLAILIAGALILETSASDIPKDLQLTVYALFISLAYSFNGSIYIMLPVQEREERLKYALNVMGCRSLAYWSATFAFDFLVFLTTLIILIITLAIGDVRFIMDYAGKVFICLIAFSISYIPFSYMCGFLYQKSNTALKIFPIFCFFAVFNLPFCIMGPMAMLKKKGYIGQSAWEGLCLPLTLVIFCISPFYVMQWGIDLTTDFINQRRQKGDMNFYLISYQWWVYVLVSLLQAILYFGVTYYLERQKYSLKVKASQSDLDQIKEKVENYQKVEDEGVEKEKQRITNLSNNNDIEKNQEGNQNQKDKVIVKELWKQYENGFVALKDVSYGIKKGEIFGLLGPNGAGKSTSFNILTSLIPRSFGSVQIKDIEVNKGIMEIYQDVGICPQFDCLWPSLNPIEHLYLFGRMKGLQGNDLKEAVEYFMQIMQLEAFIKTRSMNLSGGNKRKLCVSDALIGGPDIQFFDEPSTGVDPIARRFLWNTLQEGAKIRDSAIVLTTHTMEEAESLCTKIGILINGQFYCLGTPSELKDKYGEGYTITIKGNQDIQSEFSQKIKQEFPNVNEMKDKQEQYYNFRIKKNEFSFGKAFEVCEELKKNNKIQDFSINQSTLEEVFVYFSKYQEVKKDDQ